MKLHTTYKYLCSNCKKTVLKNSEVFLNSYEGASELSTHLIVKYQNNKLETHICHDSNSHGIYAEFGVLNLVGIVVDQNPAGTIQQKYPCIESTIDIPLDLNNGIDKFLVRVWFNENTSNISKYGSYDCFVDNIRYIVEQKEKNNEQIDVGIIVEMITSLNYSGTINAVQVKNLNSPLEAGVMIYTVPF